MTEAAAIEIERHETEEAWLKSRRLGVGASEVAALFNRSPWSTPLDLWSKKLGLAPPMEVTTRMRMGQRLEPIIAEMFAEETGLEVVDHGRFTMVWRKGEIMFSSLDREAKHAAWGPGIVEIKNTGWERTHDWPPVELSGLDAEAGPDEIPWHVWCQIQVQAHCSGARWAAVAVLVGTDDFRYFKVGIDAEFGTEAAKTCQQFWQFVVNNMEPPASSGDDASTVYGLHPDADEAATVGLPGEAVEWDEELQVVKARLGTDEKRKGELEAMITQHIGDAKFGMLPNGIRYSWPTINIKERICTQDMVGSVLRKASSHRRLFRKVPK